MDLVMKLVSTVLDGSFKSVIAILLLIIGFLIYDRMNMYKNIQAQNTKFEKVINDYYDVMVKINDTINSLKMVLQEIKSKL